MAHPTSSGEGSERHIVILEIVAAAAVIVVIAVVLFTVFTYRPV